MLVSELTPQQRYYRRVCKTPEYLARHAAQERRNRERKVRFIRLYKLLWGCVDCGYNEDASALDLDHVTGEKSFNLSTIRNKSWKRVFAELEKCVVRCANCHRVKSFGGRRVGI